MPLGDLRGRVSRDHGLRVCESWRGVRRREFKPTIALDGANGITVRYPEFQAVCKGRGSDAAMPNQVEGEIGLT
jgi:hypothetical protein